MPSAPTYAIASSSHVAAAERLAGPIRCSPTPHPRLAGKSRPQRVALHQPRITLRSLPR
ncbi:hypothetical protein BD626DRAFT_208353 [Schizophyllum amplum]|uniref:Uncharacterized protein n=1 Tax=Schizophyllum amplum TaxID=97359 RepID=A0A550BYM9_9AGAR|nr:hypothetical protein BD626DRAFT_208353 [Auriculariopsis ampla]